MTHAEALMFEDSLHVKSLLHACLTCAHVSTYGIENRKSFLTTKEGRDKETTKHHKKHKQTNEKLRNEKN